MMQNFRADMRRYREVGRDLRAWWFYAFFDPVVWAIAVYRFVKGVQKIGFAPLRWPFLLAYFFLSRLVEIIAGVRIAPEAEIGPGLEIHNCGGIIIKAKVGKNCTVMQGAQLISRANNRGEGWPTVGDDVMIGAGAKVLGEVTIGNNVRVGANAVVMYDVPDDSVVMPPESRIIKGFYKRKAKAAAAQAADNGEPQS